LTGSPPDYDALVASLLGEPYRLRVGEILALTDRQLYDLYLHPRDKQGVPIPGPAADAGKGRQMTAAEEDALMRQIAEAMGVPASRVAEVEREAKHAREGRGGEGT
jgi:hypothetical protein